MSFDDGNWNPEVETHAQWKRRRILEAQRWRRSRERRLDYYASPAAVAVVDSLRVPSVGGDASSILNRIVTEWAEREARNAVRAGGKGR